MSNDDRDESGKAFIPVDPLTPEQIKAIKDGLEACRKALEEVRDELKKRE